MLPTATRLANGLRKLAAGLRPFSESVWPGVRNDLFVAHESIYHFFAQFAEGGRVLDAGCGTGYGAAILIEAGAANVLGVDDDAANIRYARRRYESPRVRFEKNNLDDFDCDGSFDLVVSSNVMEHLDVPEAFLHTVWTRLERPGRLLVAVPPITNSDLARQHDDIHYHRANKTVDEWIEVFRGLDRNAKLYRHIHKRGVRTPDFFSVETSALRSSDFEFIPADRDAVYTQPTITVIFEIEKR